MPTGRDDVVIERPAVPLKYVADDEPPSGPVPYVIPETEDGFSDALL